MHPYRDAPEPSFEDEEPLLPPVGRVIATTMAVLGGIRVFVALLAGDWFGAAPWLALAMLIGGLLWIGRRSLR